MTTSTPDHTDAALLAWAAQQTWSSFATDVAAKGRRFGLSERQRAALQGMKDKCDAKAAPTTKAAPAPANIVSGFGSALAMLDHIEASGNKWPKMFFSMKSDVEDTDEARRIKFYRYQHGQRTGQGGLMLGDAKLGIVDRGGNWHPSEDARVLDVETKRKVWNVMKLLRDDPATLFARNGKLLGTCACCGRPLSNDESVQIGIGPECRSKLGGMV